MDLDTPTTKPPGSGRLFFTTRARPKKNRVQHHGAHLQEEAFDALQAGLFFGYMLLVSLGVALVAGAAGFLASLKFLAYIFAQIKFD